MHDVFTVVLRVLAIILLLFFHAVALELLVNINSKPVFFLLGAVLLID